MQTSILYEDRDILVIYKPAGLATQTARVGQADVVSELKNYVKGGYVGVVHRLDQPVEGLLVFGKNKQAAARLTEQLSIGILNKHYYAVVCGKVRAQSGELVDYLIKTADNRAQIIEEGKMPQMSQVSAKEVPQRAVLRYQIRETIEREEQGISLADIHIETGRFHQIRAQMSHAGLPLLGDRKYGTEESLQLSRLLNVRNVALCACEISMKHPKSGQVMNFKIKPRGIIFGEFSILES